MRQVKSRVSKKFVVLLPIMLLLLTGCIGKNNWTWQHPAGYGDAERRQAVAECEAIASSEVRRYDFYYPYPFYYDRYYYHDRFLDMSRYYHYKSYREFQERRRYFRICMKSKGWRLVEIGNQTGQY